MRISHNIFIPGGDLGDYEFTIYSETLYDGDDDTQESTLVDY